jgi:hypothetical protein
MRLYTILLQLQEVLQLLSNYSTVQFEAEMMKIPSFSHIAHPFCGDLLLFQGLQCQWGEPQPGWFIKMGKWKIVL